MLQTEGLTTVEERCFPHCQAKRSPWRLRASVHWSRFGRDAGAAKSVPGCAPNRSPWPGEQNAQHHCNTQDPEEDRRDIDDHHSAGEDDHDSGHWFSIACLLAYVPSRKGVRDEVTLQRRPLGWIAAVVAGFMVD